MNPLASFFSSLYAVLKNFSLVSRLSSPVISLSSLVFLAACSDFFHPVESTPEPTEYSYNYWLLTRTYLYEDELPLLDEEGDSVNELYNKLSDPFTRYVPPAKSEQTRNHLNTSIIPGDVGMEYAAYYNMEYPILIYRVYKNGPAGRAGVPRFGNILSVNGVELKGENAFNTYDSLLTYNTEISMVVASNSDTTLYKMTKEDIYAPTVFIDTLNNIPFITITGFKLNTADQKNGTLGELRAYLEETRGTTQPRILDLRGNPGGHVSQCIAMADLFIEKGVISTRSWRSIAPDGNPIYKKVTETAKEGDAGEGGKFIALVNKGSASCAEIFAAAIQEGANIPIVGDTTYGKGIGQSSWNTMAGGLAIITNLDFLTPKNNSYHKTGIIPDYPCEPATIQCGLEALEHFYGKKSNKARVLEPVTLRRSLDMGGAILQGDSIFYLKN